MRDKPVIITQYKWAGRLGPFKIKTRCSECDLTTTLLKALIEKEFTGQNVIFETKPWLNNFFYCLIHGAWRAPIIMVGGRLFYQFSKKNPLFDKQKLIERIKAKLR